MAKILIVEDEDIVARMYEKALSVSGFQVVVNTNAGAALETTKKEKPDLVLLDIMMPGVDGIQILEKLKADSATKGIPVVILTNLSGKGDRDYSIKKGAADFWVKSDYKSSEIVKKVKAIVEKKSTQQVPVQK